MRAALVSTVIIGAASTANAQTIPVPPVGGCGQSQSLFFDDGTPEASWKVSNPAAPGDGFSVDFDAMAGEMTIDGIAMCTWQTTSTGPVGIKYVALCTNNGIDSLGHTPYLNSPLDYVGSLTGTVTVTGSPNVSAGFCPNYVGYDLFSDYTVIRGENVHAVTSFLTGDSATWLCSDTNGYDCVPNSYFSTNNYSTPATVMSGQNLMMRLIGEVNCPNSNGDTAYLTVNNSPFDVNVRQTELLTATLWSCCAIQPTIYVQAVLLPIPPYFLLVPEIALSTGYENGSTISDPNQGTVCAPLSDPTSPPCVPAGLNFAVFAFYLDNCDLKANGKPKVKKTNRVDVHVLPDYKSCNPSFCLGQVDDTQYDNVWKVQNPSGSGDYFNLVVGDISNASGAWWGAQMKSIQICSWDFCGSGPSWSSIGLYNGQATDRTTPDFASPIAVCTTLSMAPNASDFSYPGTTYDFPDVFCSTFTGNDQDVNIVARWPAGDTCIWLAADTDGTDDDTTVRATCSCIPSTSSYFTSNSYSTPAVQATTMNWMMRIEW